MTGFVLFLLLELLFLPLRGYFVSVLQRALPPGYTAVWPCTGFDELFLFVSFLAPIKGGRRKLAVMVGGSLLIVIFNLLRIYTVVLTGNHLVHELLFRFGGFLFILLLFYLSLRLLA